MALIILNSVISSNLLLVGTLEVIVSNFKKFVADWMFGKNFFSQRVVNEWNELPESVVLSNSVNGFKNALDKHFKQFSRI